MRFKQGTEYAPNHRTNYFMRIHRIRSTGLLIVGLSCFAACSTISTYDQAAYANVTSLKVDTLNVVGQATGSYSEHTKEIAELNTKLDKAYEYDHGRPLNQKTIDLWNQLLKENPNDPDSGILPHFFELWKTQGKISSASIKGEKARIGQAFDKIIALESGKNK
ncbi:MAG: hypothetical protein DME69_07060 [Verrucomicrobia bacterium]|nr:MAG: hypothetical protein DME69_07060 [Verrucomicrobiota bacterium]PYL78112.1 MAG: hypothetical protein DMF26_01710 [Verrucomicrobiota bacterium]